MNHADTCATNTRISQQRASTIAKEMTVIVGQH
jgi:hypothetical protein